MSSPRKGGTRATVFLHKSGVAFSLHAYGVDFGAVDDYGRAVAEQLGIPPARLFKTLVVFADEKPMVGLVPADVRLHRKQMAKAVGARRVRMASPREAERITGYVPGGISPFGHRRRIPMVVDRSIVNFPTVWVSAGKRGLQIEIRPQDLLELSGASVAPLSSA